jgi:uncharacterized membrane protein AbrB (regulator of aidB expression)
MTSFLYDLIFVLGLAAIAVGAGLVYLPAGLIVGGILAAGSVVAMARGQNRATNPGGDA